VSAETTLTAALHLASQGVAIVPLWPLTRTPSGLVCTCSAGTRCPSAGKHPIGALAPRGSYSATDDAATIKGWWQACPNANVGMGVRDRVVVDVDPRNGGVASIAALESAVGEFPPTITVFTGGGGLHFYFAHPGGRVHGQLSEFPGIDFKCEGSLVVLPPSLHLSGERYEWADGADPNSVAVAAMPQKLAELLRIDEIPAATRARTGPRAPMWERGEALLRFGDTHGRYGGDASRLSYAITREAILSRWTLDDVYEALACSTNLGGRKVQGILATRGERAARGYVARAYSKLVTSLSTSEVGQRVAAARTQLYATAWPGKAGCTNRKVLEALLQVAERAAEEPFSASERQLSELSLVPQKTIHAALLRLERERCWFTRASKGRGQHASSFVLAVDAASATRQDSTHNVITITSPTHVNSDDDSHALFDDASHDLWASPARGRPSLGPSAGIVHAALHRTGGATTRQLSEQLPLSRGTIRRNLNRLAEVGLAARADGRVWLAVEADLDKLAADLGVVGTRARLRTIHELDRRGYRNATRMRAQQQGCTVDLETGEMLDAPEHVELGRAV
jgi:Bifunctional DNA primase/polymerase, N-terminal/DeoR-like helix-turn-helix domain